MVNGRKDFILILFFLSLSLSLSQRVPLVVEFCVREVEEHGLDVEGIYR